MNRIEVSSQDVEQYLCVRIIGGLGNQMFQYAAALAQARRLDKRLLLDVIGSERLEHASFGLSHFPISADLWQPAAPTGRALQWIQRFKKAKRQIETWPGPRYRHDSLTVADGFQAIKPGTYLSGYYQSEAYFHDHADLIRAEFSLDRFDSELNMDSVARIADGTTVSVHIRRGDYLKDPKVLAIHGIMEDDYYQRARTLMQAICPDCTFCIFSDDQEAADALTRDWPNRVLMPPADRMHDLALMTRCDHHIIANSSFSWWGAWLNPSKGKRVVAPRRWFTRQHMQTTYIDDICPKGWILL